MKEFVAAIGKAAQEKHRFRPLPRRPVPAATLLERWQRLPAVDAAKLQADLDALLEIDGRKQPPS